MCILKQCASWRKWWHLLYPLYPPVCSNQDRLLTFLYSLVILYPFYLKKIGVVCLHFSCFFFWVSPKQIQEKQYISWCIYSVSYSILCCHIPLVQTFQFWRTPLEYLSNAIIELDNNKSQTDNRREHNSAADIYREHIKSRWWGWRRVTVHKIMATTHSLI